MRTRDPGAEVAGEGTDMIEHFHKPRTVREALGLKRRFRDRAVFLAGGSFVNSNEFPARPEHCISLEGLGLDRIARARGKVVIGALCTLQRLIDDRRIPAPLRAAASQVMSRNVRNLATLGGHVAAHRSGSDVIPMLMALEAKVVLSRPGGAKTLSVGDYVAKPPAGLITSIVVPALKAGRVTACRNFRGSANARSIVSAAVSATAVRGALRGPILALAGVGRTVVRLTAVERALHGRPLPALDEVQALVGRSVRPPASLAGSAAFLRHEAGVVVALALRDALRRKGARP
jgi:putative selenate reductase FAD-binding subunit